MGHAHTNLYTGSPTTTPDHPLHQISWFFLAVVVIVINECFLYRNGAKDTVVGEICIFSLESARGVQKWVEM